MVACSGLGLLLAGASPAQADDNPEVVTARKARDQAEVESLRKVIDKARTESQQHETGEAYERLSQLELWLCEAAHGHHDDKHIQQAAEEGMAAAEKTVALNPSSSEAHRLEGDALGELIPHVFAGGMRYGRRSTAELDKALELDPRNVNAYIGRAIVYAANPERALDRVRILELANKAHSLYVTQTPQEKAKLLRMVLSNLRGGRGKCLSYLQKALRHDL
jgi:tetratricopeptide (TPR) repeat protein